MTAIKICGLTRLEDVRAAEGAGATYGGVILASGSPRTMRPEDVPGIFEGSRLRRVGVFVNSSFEMISRLVDEIGLEVVQLHGDEDAALGRRLRGELGVETWKALRPRTGEEFVSGVAEFAGAVDGILLDGWSKAARGGTGTAFPWEAVAAHRAEFPDHLSFIAAGGLNPENVWQMVELLAPDVVDVSSGVEARPGVKDRALVESFAGAVRGAAQNVAPAPPSVAPAPPSVIPAKAGTQRR